MPPDEDLSPTENETQLPAAIVYPRKFSRDLISGLIQYRHLTPEQAKEKFAEYESMFGTKREGFLEAVRAAQEAQGVTPVL